MDRFVKGISGSVTFRNVEDVKQWMMQRELTIQRQAGRLEELEKEKWGNKVLGRDSTPVEEVFVQKTTHRYLKK